MIEDLFYMTKLNYHEKPFLDGIIPVLPIRVAFSCHPSLGSRLQVGWVSR
ncbi:hypothetical protein [Wolbachia pipientis]|nr:hypothetical protein [Wolbachia pipientis]